MTLIVYKCDQCERAVAGTEADLACSFRDGLIPYWECISCCSDGSMKPLVTDSTKGIIAAFLSARYRDAAKEAMFARAAALRPRANWSRNSREGLDKAYWRVDLDNGMRLEYWPALDHYRYAEVATWRTGMERVTAGGFEFVEAVLDQLEKSS